MNLILVLKMRKLDSFLSDSTAAYGRWIFEPTPIKVFELKGE